MITSAKPSLPNWIWPIGLIAMGGLVWGRKRMLARASGGGQTQLQVLGRAALGKDGCVVLIEVLDTELHPRRVLVGLGGDGPRLLQDLSVPRQPAPAVVQQAAAPAAAQNAPEPNGAGEARSAEPQVQPSTPPAQFTDADLAAVSPAPRRNKWQRALASAQRSLQEDPLDSPMPVDGLGLAQPGRPEAATNGVDFKSRLDARRGLVDELLAERAQNRIQTGQAGGPVQ
jgi:flagellar biogenesis protein FliO